MAMSDRLDHSNTLPELRPRRHIEGISAILLPFTSAGLVDWLAFDAHVLRTADAGLVPAVNMDTGFANLLSFEERNDVLDRTRRVLQGRPFVAGAFVGDQAGARFYFDQYAKAIEAILARGGTPVIFQSFGLTQQPDEKIIASYQQIGGLCDRFIGFELGTMFAPFGKIYSLDVYEHLLAIPQCIGAKHSSLRRDLEWQRLALRDRIRPDFKVYTGNDLAIDMVMYGSDYLLGLSTMAPDAFAIRDRCWEVGDNRFFAINDILQYLGFLAFRQPVPAYKHSAAMFLKLRKWIDCDETHPQSPRRPESDREILAGIVNQLEQAMRA
jgi:dihydrodipicolinate synthase/N-acetylneuraminate lyase